MVEITPIRPEDREEWAALWGAYLAFYESDLDDATTEATFARLTAPEAATDQARQNATEGALVGNHGEASVSDVAAADARARLRGAIAHDGDGRAIGLVHWLTHLATWTRADYCYLEDLYVVPDARGAGAGAALIEHLRAWAAEHGSAKVYWLTAETNDTARRLYDRVAERSGFIHYEIPL